AVRERVGEVSMDGTPTPPIPLSVPSQSSSWGDGESSGLADLRPPQRWRGGESGVLDAWGPARGPWAMPRLWRRTTLLLLADVVALAVGCVGAWFVWEVVYGEPTPLGLWPALVVSGLCIAAYAASGLYNAFPLPPVEEV